MSSDLYTRIDGAGKSRVGPSTHITSVTAGGGTYAIVDGTPEDLASQAGLPVDVYSLARMIASENGSEGAPVLLALAEMARNKAKQRGVSVTRLLTQSSISVADESYSEQAAHKWASTRLDPQARHVEAAKIALVEGSQVFGRAIDFFDPSAQDKGAQGTHTLRKTSEQYIADRAGEGLAWIGPVDGIAPFHLMCFEPRPKPVDTAPALQALADGRSGKQIVEAVASVGFGVVALVIGVLAIAALVAHASGAKVTT